MEAASEGDAAAAASADGRSSATPRDVRRVRLLASDGIHWVSRVAYPVLVQLADVFDGSSRPVSRGMRCRSCGGPVVLSSTQELHLASPMPPSTP
jgi:hypothetical protein